MDNPAQILEDNIELIRKIVRRICQRSALQESDIEDVTSHTFERFIKNDYNIIRESRGESLSQSYLVLVITNIYKDYLRQKSGRWRSSTRAEELGDLAMRLEELLYRYHYSFEEALEIVRTEHKNSNQQPPDRYDAEELVVQLKTRSRSRTFTPGDPHLLNLASTSPDYTDSFRLKELKPLKKKLDGIIEQFKSRLNQEEKLVFKLHFSDGHGITTISRTLGKNRHTIGKIINNKLKAFRKEILDQGFNRSEINEILDYFT